MDKTKILLIEDDQVLSKVLYEELSEAGFEVLRAYDGEVGLQLALEKNLDLILLDVVLPKKDGFEILEAIKKSPGASGTPVIILTMLGIDEDIKKGLQLGADDYIVKSQHALPEIVEKVKNFFAKEGHGRAKQSSADWHEVPQPDA
ncbi:MAG TPA: response regulator [Candidatus Paceibacterota bacterium]|nr:response regulator [Candidatus Paceibacterota bacterium]